MVRKSFVFSYCRDSKAYENMQRNGCTVAGARGSLEAPRNNDSASSSKARDAFFAALPADELTDKEEGSLSSQLSLLSIRLFPD